MVDRTAPAPVLMTMANGPAIRDVAPPIAPPMTIPVAVFRVTDPMRSTLPEAFARCRS